LQPKLSLKKSCYIGTGSSTRKYLRAEGVVLVGLGCNVICSVAAGFQVRGNLALAYKERSLMTGEYSQAALTALSVFFGSAA